MTAHWRPTRALLSATGGAAALLWLAVAAHRPDLIVLAAPLVAGLVVNLARTPSRRVSASLGVDSSTLLEGQETELVLTVEAPDADLVTSSVRPGSWLALRGTGVRTTAASTSVIGFPVHAVRWSRTRTGSATVLVAANQGLFRSEVTASGTGLKILPLHERFGAVDALPNASGTVGAHRSRRPGDGTDLAGVRPFAPGDRLKRINWPVSLRTGELHVTATVSDRDTVIMIVLDSSVDVSAAAVSPVGGSLDVAVHAAASIAEHYLRTGDRVGLLDHARALRPIRPAAGRAHLDRIIDRLLDVTPRPGADDAGMAPILRRIAPHATVMLLSPLLGSARPERAVEIAQSGHSVLVVDTLGNQAPTDTPREWTDLAWRLQLLQRRADIDQLAAHGIPVVPWRGDGSLDEVLLALSRAAAAPRLR
jgi:uncharacterized protein (DUF58 family)